MADHITKEYELARNRDLNDMEAQNQNSTFYLLVWYIEGELRICLVCLEGPHEGQQFPLIVKSVGACIVL